jgi:hypothetical protein
MNQITVKKSDLLSILKTNRENHINTFNVACTVYRERVIKEMDKNLERARRGDKIVTFISLPQPENYTEDYNIAIEMLEMSVEKTVVLTSQQFKMYVKDDWGWAKSFASNTSSYVNNS